MRLLCARAPSSQIDVVASSGLSESAAASALKQMRRSHEEVSRLLEVVSLGSSCGTKLSIQRLGLGAASMPFDWMRTTAGGLCHWLRNDFEGFLETRQRLELTFHGHPMTVYRSETHSFWHDNLDDPGEQEKLCRRVKRFQELAYDAEGRALLFVRAVARSEELAETEAVFDLLRAHFTSQGRRVFLLVIVEGQSLTGPIYHSGREGVLFWAQGTYTGKLVPDLNTPKPHEAAIAFAVRWILGDLDGDEEVSRSQGHEVSEASALVGPDSTLGLKETDAGMWVGDVLLRGATKEVLLSAFEGFDHVMDHMPKACTGSSAFSPSLARTVAVAGG